MLMKTPRGTNMKPHYARAVRAGIASVQLWREASEYSTPQQVQILYEVALKPGITMQELMQNTGLALSSISRNLAALGEWQSAGKPGMNFLETIEDPEERRRKIVFLTPKGRTFVQRQLQLFCPDETVELVNTPTAKEWLNKVHRAR